MVSKNVTKLIQNLEKKKFREKYNLFKIEGEKMVDELLRSTFKIKYIFASEKWYSEHNNAIKNIETYTVTESEMKSFSDFQSLPQVLAIAEIPTSKSPLAKEIREELVILLNGVQDPGNLGTIFRVADWFGIKHIICDRNCASIHNSKAVQASMGAIFRVNAIYIDNAEAWIEEHKTPDFKTFGTFLNGENIYRTQLPQKGIIIMGNEGHGISNELENLTDTKITIPSFANSEFHTESLNVGVATGIILSEFKRGER
jgi:TrmH family RNA methyltransferase